MDVIDVFAIIELGVGDELISTDPRKEPEPKFPSPDPDPELEPPGPSPFPPHEPVEPGPDVIDPGLDPLPA